MRQFDVTSAYLHRPLREIIYMHAPPGLEHPTDPTLVWHLLKPLYGTIQGGDYWAEERDEFMVDELGWRKLISDAAVYLKEWDNIHIHNIPGVRMGGGVGTIASEHVSDHVTHIT